MTLYWSIGECQDEVEMVVGERTCVRNSEHRLRAKAEATSGQESGGSNG